jgi:hypothetical protein
VDFIHRGFKFFLLNCELCCEPELGDAGVSLTDPLPLLRHHLEPDFPGDFAKLLNELNSAVCHYLKLTEKDGPPEQILYDFLTGPEWPDRHAQYDSGPVLPACILDYMPDC